MSRVLLVCLGGAIGTGARYLVQTWAVKALGPAFPFGTLIVNALGSFLICGLMQVSALTELIPSTLRIVLTVGVLGGFTTYSSFDYETFAFVKQGAWGLAALNVASTVVVCFIAGALGDLAARMLLRV